jgi:hypothetical protein
LPPEIDALTLKKALTYLILILFLFNSVGYYYLFELNKQLARKEMQTMIPRHPSKLAVITIADIEKDREFQRIDKKEFRYKGTMYDIVREIKKGQTTVFICLHDAKESRLFAGLKNATQNKLYFALWEQLVMFLPYNPSFDLTPGYLSKLIFPRMNIIAESSMLQTWSPPPELS